MSAFVLDAVLAADTVSLGVCDGVDVRLMRDARYFWLVLVPQIDGAVEWYDLPSAHRQHLFEATMQACEVLRHLAQADKINVAALGNRVRQLHVHVIARHKGDAAWPDPVWGVGTPLDYDADMLAVRGAEITRALAL